MDKDTAEIVGKIIALIEESSEVLIDDLLEMSKDLPSIIRAILVDAADLSKGYLVNSEDTLNALIKVKNYLDAQIETDEYKTIVTKYIDNIEEIDNLSKKVQLAANGLTIDPIKLLGKERKYLIDTVRFMLGESGYKGDILQPLINSVTQSVLTGGGLKELENTLKAQLTADRLRYTKTAARDGLSAYYGTQNQLIAAEYDLGYYLYIGTIKESSRPFCRHVINDMDGIIPKDELPALINRYKGTSGFRPNTTPANFAIIRGGPGCMHQAIPTIIKP